MFEPIPIEIFEKRVGKSCITGGDFTNGWGNADKIVSLRQVKKVVNIQSMHRDYLRLLLLNVRTQNGDEVYKDCNFETMRIDPVSLRIGQTFIERPKYRSFIEGFDDVFKDFHITNGIAKLTAMILLCELEDGSYGIAHYLPPIIEKNSGVLCLLDGVHRNFLVKQVGTTLEAIVISGVSVDFPSSLHGWGDVGVVDEKPPPDERFTDLREDLFRNLKVIGIDG